MKPKPSFREAFLFWLKLGFISFGGPAGQIAIMHDALVVRKKWISESRFLHALNYCMLLPGPEAQQLATYIGWLMHGTKGGLVAGILFVLPSVFILLGLSTAYVAFGNIPWVNALFKGLQPAIIAIVALALIRIGKKSLKTPVHYLLALASFIGIFFFQVPFPLLILAVIAAGWIFRNYLKEPSGPLASASGEEGYFIHQGTPAPVSGWKTSLFIRQVMAAILLWLIPLVMLMLLSAETAFWKKLVLFFTQAALVTFGGAYAVLPYVAQVTVEKFNWLSSMQMLDGLALGETTPGPLIMVLAFVGFVASWNHYGHSLAHGAAGLFTTVYYTFLPCFFFIFSGAPVIEATRENLGLKSILSLVTSAITGVIMSLLIYLGGEVVFPDGTGAADLWNLVWILFSFAALYFLRLNLILWIVISALTGLFRLYTGLF